MNDNPAQTELGFIAQEVQSLFPDLVVTAKDPSKTLGLNYPGFIAPMVKAMQELKADNDNFHRELKAANDNLVSETVALRLQLKAAADDYVELKGEVETLKRALR